MSIVSLTNVEKSFAERRLFTTVSFALEKHDHAVLVGRNGSGKTTLLRLIAGAVSADSGTIARARRKRIWLHEQTPELNRDQAIADYLLTAFGDAVRLESDIHSAEQVLSSLNEQSPELHDAMLSYQQLQRRFEAAGGYRYRGELAAVLEGLGFPRVAPRTAPSLAVGRRADARDPGQRAARRRRPAAARRADQPPRHRLGGVARGVPADDARPSYS